MLRDIGFKISYASTSDSLGRDFLCPALRVSSLYARVTGYFSSSLWLLMQTDLVDFVESGGKMLLVCSPAVSKNDLDAIESAGKNPSALQDIAKSNLREFFSERESSDGGLILCYLLSAKILEIKFAFLSDEHFETSIFHEKFGFFEDQAGDSVSFIGSVNETFQGWSERGNGESIDVFSSWVSERDAERIKNHKSRFASIWENKYESLAVYPPDREVLDVARAYASEGAEAYRKLVKKRNIQRYYESLSMPPKPLDLMEHQVAVIEDWKKKEFRGIVQFATGAGKTFVGLEVIRLNAKDNLPTVVIVPSELLFEQWQEEIFEKIPETHVIAVSGRTRDWRDEKKFRRSLSMCSSGKPVAVVVTIGSMVRERFQENLRGPQAYAIIADEAHQCGAPQIQSVLKKLAPKRVLGLSATPERFGDEDGTRFVFDYFGEKLAPEISLNKAIEMGRLVPYEYYPRFVHLTDDEATEWRRLSLEIARLYGRARANSDTEALALAEMKSHQRSRIAKKAQAKIKEVVSILKDSYRNGDKWLVYCEDQDHISEMRPLIERLGIPVTEYHSSLDKAQREAVLSWLDWNDGVVLSIRCLDEGVDIPAVDKALIVSSSQNPRQFVQRRGRVLRKAKNKEKAVIHDVLVVPTSSDFGDSFERLVWAEIVRAREFAQTSLNPSALAKIDAELAKLGLSSEALLLGEESDE